MQTRQDIGAQIDETGWERAYVAAVMQRLDVREAASKDRSEIREVVRDVLAPFRPTEYEVTQIANAVTAKLRDSAPLADTPPRQSREQRLYR